MAFAAAAVSMVSASGPLGIYGIVEKVILEPNDRAPERIQVWGAFAYVDGGGRSMSTSGAKRGFLYFKLPDSDGSLETVRNEWADLRAVAGTGQAIGFGSWGYVGRFEGLQPDTRSTLILEAAPRGGKQTDLRVRPAAETPASPAAYQTNAGIVKLADGGSHAAIVKQLKDALKR